MGEHLIGAFILTDCALERSRLQLANACCRLHQCFTSNSWIIITQDVLGNLGRPL
ncbi:MAG: hypothetical protein AB1589_34680 [Cyanobacteriota bacterium]